MLIAQTRKSEKNFGDSLGSSTTLVGFPALQLYFEKKLTRKTKKN
jgi:hypothetical protein